jgi:hypothetical protein
MKQLLSFLDFFAEMQEKIFPSLSFGLANWLNARSETLTDLKLDDSANFSISFLNVQFSIYRLIFFTNCGNQLWKENTEDEIDVIIQINSSS